MDYEEANNKKRLTPAQAKLKAEHYCAYQERCQQEVRDKLYSWGLYPEAVETIIAELILDNFLNEERFAKAYVSGKFTMKGWGKRKIQQGLKQKQVPTRMIKEALAGIDATTYYDQLCTILTKKGRLIKEVDAYKRKAKLAQYAIGRGYESDLIFDILNNNNL
ncbi:regulatory protein RecX [Olivibacter ginsenosidimutans]|uniref:Regulatory protein RecX n=1 Tax=Olivibacter ginsenosidimutans TaxID=1176537 RepID=A0ABP9BBV2_9SPHI